MSEGIRLYNTLTRSKEPFVPIDPDNVRMYVCGPTVYDYAHIGNARPAIVFDVLFRLLRHLYGPDHVTYVRNITDVDDKINARAARDYPKLPLNEAIRKVTEATNAQFQADVKALGCLDPTVQPRATEHVAEMIAMTQTLVAKGNAYAAEGHVLFDVKSFRSGGELEYGKLSRRSLDDMIAGARVEVAPYKRDPMDFVLWKPSTPEEPGWDSPWGRGRPGWHLECSAMSEKHLGEMFDIHGGGIDLAFPHHENELAQSRCAHDTPMMAQVWMHNGFLQVEGKKMAKSEGNFVTVRQLLNDWPADVIRLNMLKTHYRQPIDWTLAALRESQRELREWTRTLSDEGVEYTRAYRDGASVDLAVIDKLVDDLNTPGAISRVGEFHAANKDHPDELATLAASLEFLGFQRVFEPGAFEDAIAYYRPETLRTNESAIYDLATKYRVATANNDIQRASIVASEARLLGISLAADEQSRVQVSFVDDKKTTAEHAEEAIANRLTALASKDFATADRIRAELLAQGIQLMDSKDPATGARITTWEVKR